MFFITVDITFLLFEDQCRNEESCTTTATSDHLGAVLEHSRAQSATDVHGNKYLLCVCVCARTRTFVLVTTTCSGSDFLNWFKDL